METKPITLTVNGVEVLTPRGIAQRYAMSYPGVVLWRQQPDFPKPVLTTGGKSKPRHLYAITEIDTWLSQREVITQKRNEAMSVGARVARLAFTNPTLYAEIESMLAE